MTVYPRFADAPQPAEQAADPAAAQASLVLSLLEPPMSPSLEIKVASTLCFLRMHLRRHQGSIFPAGTFSIVKPALTPNSEYSSVLKDDWLKERWELRGKDPAECRHPLFLAILKRQLSPSLTTLAVADVGTDSIFTLLSKLTSVY